MNRLHWLSLGALLLAVTACHREVEMTPLTDRKIKLTDKFYDVEAVSPEKAVIVGYGGKILTTEDSGRSWSVASTGTENAIFKVALVDEKTGWAVGQAGTVLKTTDGGKTWQPVEVGTDHYLFSLYVISPEHVIVVGDRSTILETTDGGATWNERKFEPPPSEDLGMEATAGLDESLIAQDPAFYDVEFVDDQTGWIVGEFGKILKSTDGGKSWSEQQETLVGGEFIDALDLPTFFGIDCIDASQCAAVGLNGKIASTTDGGETWSFEEVGGDFTEPLFTVQLFPDGTGWAAGVAGQVMKRENGKWQPADLGMRVFSWLRQVGFADANNGWLVGGFGLVLHTRDGGKTWIPAAA